MKNYSARIVLQPWLGFASLIVVAATVLAASLLHLSGHADRYQGVVHNLETGAAVPGAFVEVVWRQAGAADPASVHDQASATILQRNWVRTDRNGHFSARLSADPDAPLVAARTRVEAFTARVYAPGLRFQASNWLPLNSSQRNTSLAANWWSSADTLLELDVPDHRDQAGDVRLISVAGSDRQRLSQLYAGYLQLLPLQPKQSVQADWLAALCREADRLELTDDADMQLREQICSPQASAKLAMHNELQAPTL